MVLDDVGEILTVRRAAARIGVDDDVAFGRHPVELVGEGVAVGSVGSAVDLEDHRIFFRRAESGRLEDPTLDTLAVEAVVPEFFWRGQVQRGEQSFVHPSDFEGRGKRGESVYNKQISDVHGCRDQCDEFRSVRARRIRHDVLVARSN